MPPPHNKASAPPAKKHPPATAATVPTEEKKVLTVQEIIGGKSWTGKLPQTLLWVFPFGSRARLSADFERQLRTLRQKRLGEAAIRQCRFLLSLSLSPPPSVSFRGVLTGRQET